MHGAGAAEPVSKPGRVELGASSSSLLQRSVHRTSRCVCFVVRTQRPMLLRPSHRIDVFSTILLLAAIMQEQQRGPVRVQCISTPRASETEA